MDASYLARNGRYEIVNPDWKTTHPDSCRMPDRVGDRAGRAGDADFTDALDAERVYVGIVFVDHQRLQARHIGVHQDVVLRKVGVERPAGAAIDDSLLVQRK